METKKTDEYELWKNLTGDNPEINEAQNVPDARPTEVPKSTVGIKRVVMYVLIGVVLLAVIGFSLFVFLNKNNVANPASQPASGIQGVPDDVESLLAEVGQYIVLPQDPDVTVATVTEPEALQSQAFFRNAIIGDKVLIWANTRKAILYRPSIKKIIEVTSVEVLAPSSASTSPRQ